MTINNLSKFHFKFNSNVSCAQVPVLTLPSIDDCKPLRKAGFHQTKVQLSVFHIYMRPPLHVDSHFGPEIKI